MTKTETKHKAGLDLLLISFYSFIAIGLPAGVLNVAWASIQDSFGLALDSLGVLLFAGTVGYLVSSMTSGQLMPRLGTGKFLLFGSLIGGAGALGYALAPAWWLVVLSGFVVGLGSGVLDAGGNTFVAANYSASRLNWLHACFGIGVTVGPVLVTTIVIDLGQAWQWSYVAVAVVQGALAVSLLLTLRRWRLGDGSTDAGPGTVASRTPLHKTLGMAITWLSMALFFVYGSVEIGAGQLANSLLTEARSIDPKTASAWISFYWGSFTVGRMVLGVVIDRIGNIRLLRLGMAGAVVGAALIWWNPSDVFSFIGLAVLGFSLAGLFPTLISETPRRVGMAHTANLIGLQIGATGLGGAILPGLAGALAEHLGLEIIGPFLTFVALGTLLLHEFIILREARALPTEQRAISG